jgi:hypothetical protein
MKRTSLLAILTLSAGLTFAGEERSIFNGVDFTGWDGNKDLWSVVAGTITGTTGADPANPKQSILKHNSFLVWRGGWVKDFELNLKYRIVDGNSGIQYRSKELAPGAQGPIVSGYQADFEAGPKYSGILYEERGRGILALRGESVTVKEGADPKKPELIKGAPVGDSDAIQAAIQKEAWNEYRIVAKGGHLEHFINGNKTVDVQDDTAAGAKEGILALQIHVGPPMIVQFKDIKLKDLE